jgi:HK97 family phage major capsid protein
MTAKIGAAVDLAALARTGSGAQPTGISRIAGTNTQSSSGADPTWAQVVSAVTSVKAQNAGFGSLGWALGSYEEGKLKQTQKIAGSNYPEFLINDETPGMLNGYPYLTSSQIGANLGTSPASVNGLILFGSFDQVITAFWGGVEILLNPFESTAFTKGNVQIRALIDADILIRHAESFTVWSSIKVY